MTSPGMSMGAEIMIQLIPKVLNIYNLYMELDLFKSISHKLLDYFNVLHIDIQQIIQTTKAIHLFKMDQITK